MTAKQKTPLKLGGQNCKYRVGAGSYYDMLPWCECSKQPSNRLVGGLEMCDEDAGTTCRFVKEVTK